MVPVIRFIDLSTITNALKRFLVFDIFKINLDLNYIVNFLYLLKESFVVFFFFSVELRNSNVKDQRTDIILFHAPLFNFFPYIYADNKAFLFTGVT